MTINSIHRLLPNMPEIRVFSLLNQKKDIDVELIISSDPDGNRTIRACLRKGKELKGLALKNNSADDAVEFVRLLWDSCKSDENYTISNASRIGTMTAKLFPDFACTRPVFDAVEDHIGIIGEEMVAFVMAVKNVRHRKNIALYPEAASPSVTKRWPAVAGSLAVH